MQKSASRDSARLRSHAPLVGPGGVNCVCCGYAAGTKVKERRFVRHRSKNHLRKMVSNSTLEDV